jgi:ribosomal protein S12 methylthiotransferase accessory factor
MSGVAVAGPRVGDAAFSIWTSSLGNVAMTFPHLSVANDPEAVLGGSGVDVDNRTAWLCAVVEGAERYANCVHSPEDFVVATAADLGDSAMDLDRLPRCSDREYADPKCPLVKPERNLPLRWARGYSLIDRCERFVPAILTHLFLTPMPGERITIPISTGVAAHTSLAAALVSAICEVIERDAISLTWLARLRLPEIDLPETLPPQIARSRPKLERSSIRHHLFDASTDLGIPTVFSVEDCRDSQTAELLVDCATSFDAAACCAKTMRESAAVRFMMRPTRNLPADVADFTSLFHGATYFARGGHRVAFDFLLAQPPRRTLADVQALSRVDPEADSESKLRLLVERLRALGMDAVAVDLTTDEIRQAGLFVVRVVIPDLMPMSPVYRARFLGTPRLYEYPERAGFGVLSESDINPEPMPFA